MPETNLSPPRRSAGTALNYHLHLDLPTVVKRRKFWRFYVLKRVFLQCATHLGTQTEYLLAKYPESDPTAT